MHVLVSVDVIERQPSCAKRFELRSDLNGELVPHPRQKVKSKAGAHHSTVEHAGIVDETPYGAKRRARPSLDEDDVQPDAQFR